MYTIPYLLSEFLPCLPYKRFSDLICKKVALTSDRKSRSLWERWRQYADIAAERLDLIQHVLKGSIFCVCPDNDTKAVVLVLTQLFFIIIPQAFRKFGRYADSCISVGQHSISSGKTDIAGYSRRLCLYSLLLICTTSSSPMQSGFFPILFVKEPERHLSYHSNS